MDKQKGALRGSPNPFMGTLFLLVFSVAAGLALPVTKTFAQEAGGSEVKLMQPSAGQAGAPITITFQDALDRARKNDPTFIAAALDAKSAHEDRLQARNAMLPSVTATSAYLGTQGDGGKISDGRFVTNDGIHVYHDTGNLHVDVSPALLMGTSYKRAKAAEALANAKAEIARRGLTATVSKSFYALAVAQRKYASSQQALEQAKHFLDMAQSGEHQGQASHSDSLKAEIQERIQAAAYDEARLAMEDARLNLAVMLFPTFNENFTVVDDLDTAQALPGFSEIQGMAEKENPDMRVAIETARQSDFDVKSAKMAFLPTITVDTEYGIEANCFALRCARAAFPEVGVVPNLGYFMTATLTLPVWDWGTLRSKLHQAEYKQQESKSLLSQEQRLAVSELYAAYNEAAVARSAVEESRKTAELATESLRLVNLRYEGGASPASEVVDAENTLLTARNGYIDAQARYRAALAALQTITGSF
ncbi:MAG: TolC family protein [Acidobacteriia bacterium]|nr:TolC family protein [Terriglobia bacterium]